MAGGICSYVGACRLQNVFADRYFSILGVGQIAL
jgi:hypothetical protein